MQHHLHPIDGMHTSVEATLEDVLATGHPVAGENLQARLRAIIVMGHANANGSMAQTTGNKSEIAQGYCTLYGDMAGGYAAGRRLQNGRYAMAERFNQRAAEA